MNNKAGLIAVEAFAKGMTEGAWRGKLEAANELYQVRKLKAALAADGESV